MMDYPSPFTKGGKKMEPTVKLGPASWEITAFSFGCDYIGDRVTVRVTRDWLAKCAWYLKYKAHVPRQNGQKMDKAIKQRIGKISRKAY
jgi:hypothetical protein